MHKFYQCLTTKMIKTCGNYWVTLDKVLMKKLWVKNLLS